ncbi:hypothetical protein [Paenibacillus naphthalenovorans]|uniref:hypothetical protein n=1 Tax=Paenibacillus naphthalenovorans TaxID=162209 RepID=UPI0009433C0F|nr:hypothetical protein [Paenibacillus naphthalenovorans]
MTHLSFCSLLVRLGAHHVCGSNDTVRRGRYGLSSWPPVTARSAPVEASAPSLRSNAFSTNCRGQGAQGERPAERRLPRAPGKPLHHFRSQLRERLWPPCRALRVAGMAEEAGMLCITRFPARSTIMQKLMWEGAGPLRTEATPATPPR